MVVQCLHLWEKLSGPNSNRSNKLFLGGGWEVGRRSLVEWKIICMVISGYDPSVPKENSQTVEIHGFEQPQLDGRYALHEIMGGLGPRVFGALPYLLFGVCDTIQGYWLSFSFKSFQTWAECFCSGADDVKLRLSILHFLCL